MLKPEWNSNAGQAMKPKVYGYTKTTICTRKSLSEQKPWEDEVLQEVYAVRDSYAAEHGYGLDQIYADLKRREASSNLRWSNSLPLAEA
jgi:hypothetical protein